MNIKYHLTVKYHWNGRLWYHHNPNVLTISNHWIAVTKRNIIAKTRFATASICPSKFRGESCIHTAGGVLATLLDEWTNFPKIHCSSLHRDRDVDRPGSPKLMSTAAYLRTLISRNLVTILSETKISPTVPYHEAATKKGPHTYQHPPLQSDCIYWRSISANNLQSETICKFPGSTGTTEHTGPAHWHTVPQVLGQRLLTH